MPRRCVHFVGFHDDRYWSAVKVFGRHDFIHRLWDRRADCEIGPDDVIVFATGEHDQLKAPKNGDDIDERFLL